MNWGESPFRPQAGPPGMPPQQAKPIVPPSRGPEGPAADQPRGKKEGPKGAPAGPKSGGKTRDESTQQRAENHVPNG